MSTPAPTQPRRHRLLISVVLGLTLLGGGAYLVRHQIGERISRELAARLSTQGYHVTWSSAAWLPGPGVAVSDLAIYRDAARTERLFLLDNVSIFKGGSAWNEWSSAVIRCNHGTITAGTGDAELKVSDLNAEILASAAEVKTKQLEGLISSGLRLSASLDLPITGDTASGKEGQPKAVVAKLKTSALEGVDLSWLSDVKKWTAIKAKEQAPVLSLNLKREAQPDAPLAIQAALTGSNFIWRGQWWRQADLALHLQATEHPAVSLDRVQLATAADTLSATGSWNLDRKSIILETVAIDGDVPALVLAFAPQSQSALASIHSRGPWRIEGNAVLNLESPALSRASANITNQEGTTFEVAPGEALLFQNIRSTIALKDGLLTGSDTSAKLWHGSLQVERWTVDLKRPDQMAWQAGLRLSDASLSALRSSFQAGVSRPAQDGKVELVWQVRGGQSLQSIRGNGDLRITQAAFYSLPLLGPLSLLIEPLAPGFGRDVASNLKTEHSISDGKLKISDLSITSGLTRIRAEGELQLSQQTAHLVAHANLRGIPGIGTAILSEALAFEATGPLSNLQWRPAHLPGAVRDVGGAVLGLGTTAIKGTQATVKGVLSVPQSFLQQLKRKPTTQP